MKLSTKFSLFNALSRAIILLVLVVGLPPVMSRLALLTTDQRLAQTKEKVLRLIRRNGISDFIESGQSSYGSYNLLKEEFISLEEIPPGPRIDVIEDSRRAVEDEIVAYRVLSYSFAQGRQNYLLEIGRSTGSIGETERNFRHYALYMLLVAAVLTTLADLAFFRHLLRPFYTIIHQRLKAGPHHPAAFNFEPIETSTTDFRYLDESLREMMTTIQASFRKERKFIADASHELLTPLAALQYRFDNMLADDSLSDENILRVIESQRTVHRLRTIIKALLMISKIENDQFARTETVSLEVLVAELVEEVQDRLEMRGLTLTAAIEPDFEVKCANRGLLFTLIFNLVTNAIKYNREGGQVHVLGQPAPGGGYVLEVRDTGQGIAKEQLPHLFQPFEKGAATDSDSYGLGLSIAHTIAELHGIRIEVNSIPGLGTSFLLLFPAAAQ